MALNVSVLKVRTLSAIIFAIVMIGGLLWNQWSFYALVLLIQMGCLFEYQKLMTIIFPSFSNISIFHKWGQFLLGACIMILFLPKDLFLGNVNLYTVGYNYAWFLPIFIFIADVSQKKFSFQNWMITLVGLVYISVSLSLFIPLRSYMSNTFLGDFGYAIPLALITSIWVNDTMAYLVGSLIGRTPLSSISPKKTWEGTIAGIILSVFIVTKVLGSYLPIHETTLFLISLVASVTGTFGDLIESKLKRIAGVKDSGSMMPGHGGFLDRFDSILFATPFVWILLQFL